ncbi:UDP-glucose 4-epimerase GalE [Rhizobium skierniewicense]|uniref:UDP-glucose 4-epimerase GalE n=1 Tax=Rhizobium TaxID=379 RepID=UPI001FAC4E2C|nr:MULTISPECIES: UDP-glucose 4-epimerase GalE [Rhizobium]MCI9864838.1 UDP-glucose 4-epimerase GalE [Rhizobium skierniewicense]
MSVLVTGGGGYIGSHMVWALLDANEDVVVIDNFVTGFRWSLPAECRVYEGDVGDESLLNEIFSTNEIDAIIHFAGSSIVPASVSDPLSYYNNNTSKSRTLIECAVRSSIPNFVFSSTAAVYGTPKELGTVDETRETIPESPYGSSKLMTEIMLRDASTAYPFHYTALRYFNVAGADPRGRTGQSTKSATHLIKSACKAALGLRPHIDVYGTDYPTRDGTCIRDFIHVWDLVEAHLLALKKMRETRKSSTFNCGYGQGYSVLEVIEAVEIVSGKKIVRNNVARRRGDPVMVVANPALAIRELDWHPRHNDLNAIVGSALAWERHLLTKNAV